MGSKKVTNWKCEVCIGNPCVLCIVENGGAVVSTPENCPLPDTVAEPVWEKLLMGPHTYIKGVEDEDV
jgi:hypothetical protein